MTEFPLPPLQTDRQRAAWTRQIEALLDKVDGTQTELGARVARHAEVTVASSTLGPQITKFKMGDPSTLRQWMETEESPRLRALAAELGLPDTAAFYDSHRRARGGAATGTEWHPGFPALDRGQVEIPARLGAHDVGFHGEQLWSEWARWQRDKDTEAASPPFLRIVGTPGSGRRTAAKQVAAVAHAKAVKEFQAERSRWAAAPPKPRWAQIIDIDAGETADPENGPVIEVSTVPRPFEGLNRPGRHVAPAAWRAADIVALCDALRPHLGSDEQKVLTDLCETVQRDPMWAAPFRWPNQVIQMLADTVAEGVVTAPSAARNRHLQAEWNRAVELDDEGRLVGLDGAFWGELWLSRLRQAGPEGFAPASAEDLVGSIRELLKGRGLGTGVRERLLSRVATARGQSRVKALRAELDHIDRLLRVDDAEGVFKSLCTAGCLRDQWGEWAPSDLDTAVLAAVKAWKVGDRFNADVEARLWRSSVGATWWRELGLMGMAAPTVEAAVDRIKLANWAYAGPVLAVYLHAGGRLRDDQVVRVWACTLAFMIRACSLAARLWPNPVDWDSAHAALRRVSRDYAGLLPMIDPTKRWASVAELIPAPALRVIEATATRGPPEHDERFSRQLREWAHHAPSQSLPASWEEWAKSRPRNEADPVLDAVVEAANRGDSQAQDWLAGVGLPSPPWDTKWQSLPWRLRARWVHRIEKGEQLKWAWWAILAAAWADLGHEGEAPDPEWSNLLKRTDTLGLGEATRREVASNLSVTALLTHSSRTDRPAQSSVPWQALHTAVALEDWPLLEEVAHRVATLDDLVRDGLRLEHGNLIVGSSPALALLGRPDPSSRTDEAKKVPVWDGVTPLVEAALVRVHEAAFAGARLLMTLGRPEAMRARLDVDPFAMPSADALEHLSRLVAVVESKVWDHQEGLDRIASIELPPEDEVEKARLAIDAVPSHAFIEGWLQSDLQLLSKLGADPMLSVLRRTIAALAYDSTLAVPSSFWSCLVKVSFAGQAMRRIFHPSRTLLPLQNRSVAVLLDHGDMVPIELWLNGETGHWTQMVEMRLGEDAGLLTKAWRRDSGGTRRKELLQLALRFGGGTRLEHAWARAAFCKELDEASTDGSAWLDEEKLPKLRFPWNDIGIIRHQLQRFPEVEAPLDRLQHSEPGAPEVRDALLAWLGEHDPVARVVRTGGAPRPHALPFDQMIELAEEFVESVDTCPVELRSGLERLWRLHVVQLPLAGSKDAPAGFRLAAEGRFDWLWRLLRMMRRVGLSHVLVETFRRPPTAQEGDPSETARAETLCRLTEKDWRKVASDDEKRSVAEAGSIQAAMSGVRVADTPVPIDVEALPWSQPATAEEWWWATLLADAGPKKAARILELVQQHADDWKPAERTAMGRALLLAEPLRGMGLDLLAHSES